mgnify:CR=1 FL=1
MIDITDACLFFMNYRLQEIIDTRNHHESVYKHPISTLPNPAVRTVAQDLCFRRVLRHEQRTLESHIVKSKGDADVSIGI